MIPLNNPALYEASLELLRKHVGRYRGKLVQIYLAAQYFDDRIPVVGSGLGISMKELEHLLDNFYRKKSRDPQTERCVLSLFSANYLFASGVQGAGQQDAANNWRNNLGFQKANICYAPEAELQDPTFAASSRVSCPHLVRAATTPVDGIKDATCALKQTQRYRGDDHEKFIRSDPQTSRLSIVDPTDHNMWRQVVVPAKGRLPVAALICALYYDSEISDGFADGVEPDDFRLDFNLSEEAFAALFDDDPSSTAHAELRANFPELTWTRVQVAPAPATPSSGKPASTATPPAASPGTAPNAVPPPSSALPVEGSNVAPPAGSHWWSAEQVAKKFFEDRHWSVKDRSRQAAGYDFEATKAGDTLYVEVKSSLSACHPVLTRREFEAASEHGEKYVLAVIENYHPDKAAEILWIRNPAALPPAKREVVEYFVRRSLWKKAITNLDL